MRINGFFGKKAQAGLEYLMTYGWAMVLIVTVASVLFFVLSTPSSKTVFSSSDPTKILLRAGNVSDSNVDIQLQNATGGKIEIKAISSVGYSKCKINGNYPPTSIAAGIQIKLNCASPADGKGMATIEYIDFSGFARKVKISSMGWEDKGPLIAHYSFNGNATDSSGYGNNCTLVGNAQISGNALSLDGTNSYADCGSSENLNFQGSLTLAAWIKPSQFPAGGYSRIIDKGCDGAGCGTASPGGYAFWLNDQWQWNPQTMAFVDYGGWVEDSNANIIQLNQWQHVALVYSATEGTITFYLNGQYQSTKPYNYSCPEYCGNPLDSSGWPLVIGITHWDMTGDFKGLIDEVKVYNTALDKTELCKICKEATPTGANCNC